MSWNERQRKRRRKCRHHKYKFVTRRRIKYNEYYVFVCTAGNHQALFEIKGWWGKTVSSHTNLKELPR